MESDLSLVDSRTKDSDPEQNARKSQTRCKNDSFIEFDQGLQSIHGGHRPLFLILLLE
jgi:hypothetical protein